VFREGESSSRERRENYKRFSNSLVFKDIYSLTRVFFAFVWSFLFGFSPKKKLLGDMEKLYAI